MKKSSLYRQTFRRHRRLLSLPIVLAVIIASWTALGSAKTYVSTASLWVDSPASLDSSLGNLNPAVLPPSQQEQQVLTELLTTRDFAISVAHRSTLAQYLAAHRSGGFGPSALLSKLGGAGSLDDRIVAALDPSRVTMTVPGPQVLQISYTGPTSDVAKSTLQAIVTELQQDSARFSQQHSEGALAYYRSQVQAASQAVAAARSQVNAFLRQHNGATAGDPNLSALQTAQNAATTQLNQANTNLSTAAGALKGGSSGSTVHEIDTPTTPTGPSSGKKVVVIAIIGGLFAGLLISFLAVVALTPTKPTRWEDEPPVEGEPVAAPPVAAPPVAAPPAPERAPNTFEPAAPQNGGSTSPLDANRLVAAGRVWHSHRHRS